VREVVAQVDELFTNKEREELSNTNLPDSVIFRGEPLLEPKL